MTTKELLEKYHPYPFWVVGDRYGGSYSGGDFTCFWNADYPEDICAGDTECMMIWGEINSGDWAPLDVVMPGDRRVGVGVGPTHDDAIWAAAKRAGIPEKHRNGQWVRCRHGMVPRLADGLPNCIYCGPPI